jgi:hypothetical protein
MWWTMRATGSESAEGLLEGGWSHLLRFQAFCTGCSKDLVSASGEASCIDVVLLLRHGHASHTDLRRARSERQVT